MRTLRLPQFPTFLPNNPALRTFIFKTGTFLTWLPALSFFHDHVGRSMTVDGRSMYPVLNNDYQSSLRKDQVWVNLHAPNRGLRRGMIVAFW